MLNYKIKEVKRPRDSTPRGLRAGRKSEWEPLGRALLWASPRTPQSTAFSRPEHCRGQPFLSPGDLPDLGIEPRSPALQATRETKQR